MVKRARIVALLLPAAAVAPPLAHPVRKSRVAGTSLTVGDAAPDFTLLTDEWKTVRLSEYRGKKNVFLAVYVLAFSEGCTKQMRAVQAGIDSGQIPTSDTAVFGVSLDSPAANAAFAEQNGLACPPPSDINPKRHTSYAIFNTYTTANQA